LVIVVEQVTVLPPPLEEPLHWLIETGMADAPPVTVHFTRSGAPPPLAEPLHWSTVAFVVFATGAQFVGGPTGETPPPPEPLHWFTVTPVVPVPTGTLFVTSTVHVTLLPPPFTMPLHWLTPVVSVVGLFVTVVVQPEGGTTPAAARHAVSVTVELVPPVGVIVLTIFTSQVTSNPAPVGKAGGLHWLDVPATTAFGVTASGGAAAAAGAAAGAAVGLETPSFDPGVGALMVGISPLT
jgi:hypothetical protein